MRRGTGLELLEALGACLVVLGLVFWSLPVALIAAGVFLVLAANAPLPKEQDEDPRRESRYQPKSRPAGPDRPNPSNTGIRS
jgi:hypothetical protein